jgi:hypothetical protein
MELYLDSVKQLPAIERLRLALLILKDLSPTDLAKPRDDEPKEQDSGDGTIELIDGPV